MDLEAARSYLPLMDKTPQKKPRPVLLCILDGWGYRKEREDNALALANIPHYRRMMDEGPWSFLATSGEAVGLPRGQMGNSEVGHMNIGGGRVLVQDLDRITADADSGALAKNKVLRDVLAKVKAAGGALHLLGLLSPGGVHSHQDHIAAIANIAAGEGVHVWVHAFLDGRDTPPKSALGYVQAFEEATATTGRVKIATIGGRFFGMDRDNRWERVEKAYDAIAAAKASGATSAKAAIATAYASGETDEFITPAVIGGYAGMKTGDAVVMCNFRADRAREIMTALLDPAFNGFVRAHRIAFAAAAGLSEYSSALARLMPALYPPIDVPNALGEVLAHHGLKQLRIAETEKYAHVTFFFNGGRETVFEGEERILVPSPKVKTYDLKPEMSAHEVTDRLVAAIASNRFDVIIANYANPDQVGHTGNLDAAIKAVEVVDGCLARLRSAIEQAGGVMLVTADHGNVEMMRDPETGEPFTQHTTFDVPLILVNGGALSAPATLADGCLADLAPTILSILNIDVPPEMTGKSLLRVHQRAEP